MKMNAKVRVTPPRGAAWDGKYVGKVTTHTGEWWEIKPLQGGEPKRCRPAMVEAL